jgi:hypothetical protein
MSDEPTIIDLIDVAKERWLEDNPTQTEFAWQLIPQRERDQYCFTTFEDHGYIKTYVNGYPSFDK